MQVTVMMLIDQEEGWKPTITSVLEQTYDNLELLCIDTKVSVKNSEMIKELANQNPRIRVYENIGIKEEAELLNLGLLTAEGHYIMKISNGMVLAPDAVERIMHVFARRKNETAICTAVLPVNRKGEVVQFLLALNEEMENVYLYNPFRICLICKKEVYDKVGGYRKDALYDINNDLCIRIKEYGFSIYYFRAKVCQFNMDETLSAIGNRADFLDLRIKKSAKTIRECRDSDLKIKMLNELIQQCKKYEKNKKCFLLTMWLWGIYNPINQNIIRNQKIKKNSRQSFNIVADSYEQNGSYDEPRKCYMPVMQLIKKYAESDLRLLDVGCGPGTMLEKIFESFPDASRIDGIDLAEEMVKQAKSRLPDQRVNVIEGTIDTINLPRNFYDIELCMHSFHHYPRPLKSLKCMNRVLRKKGILIIVENYYKGWKRLEQNMDAYVSEYSYGDMWMYSAWELIILTYMAGFYKQQFYKVGEKSFLFICQKP